MNRANQQQLFQEANQGVISIRQTELNYFINLFTVFGTNAAIIGGFTYGILTQNIIDYTAKEINLYKFCYYVLSAITIASSVHVILCTMLVQVYGPGLALHGPLGSMSRAAEGMKEEQRHIVYAVVIMVASFTAATIWLCFVVMDFYQALIATIVYLVAVRYWYIFCERIYLRFYWKTKTGLWNENIQRTSSLVSDDDNPANFRLAPTPENPTGNPSTQPAFKKKKLRFSMKWAWGKTPEVQKEETDDIEMKDDSPYGNNVLNYIFRNPANMTEEQRRQSFATAVSKPATIIDTSKKDDGGGGSSNSSSSVAMEGYFTTRGRTEQQVILESRRWERRYFVLFRSAEFYVYKSRQDFRSQPKSPIYSRPIRLSDFYVQVDNTDEELRWEYEDDSKTVSSAATASKGPRDPNKPLPYRFQITLVPRENVDEAEPGKPIQLRNHWVLRCDTEEELQIWMNAISDVCPSCTGE